jgi:predicted MFS family arabinose efflux permease
MNALTQPFVSATSPTGNARPWIAAALGTLCSAMPTFLFGAMSPQIRLDLDLSLVDIGIIIAAAFAVAATASAPMGRVSQALGAQRAFRIGLTGTALAQLLIASLGDNLVVLSLLLGFSGLCNALNQPSANLLLSTRIVPERLGLALAVKQAGMPAAALLGGAAVPLIALTFGWRWAFVASAGLALLAMALQPPGPEQVSRPSSEATPGADQPRSTKPDMGTPLLLMYAAVGYFGAIAATMLASLLTSAATETGSGPGLAGWLLSAGSAVGITSRIVHGWLADHRGIWPIRRIVWLTGIGAVAFVLFAAHRPLTYLLAVIPAFGAGWAWPGLFNLSVVRNNPSAPASATGISQMGVFVGAGSGPLIGGLIVESFGYRVVWLTAALLLASSAALAHLLSVRIRAARLRRQSESAR